MEQLFAAVNKARWCVLERVWAALRRELQSQTAPAQALADTAEGLEAQAEAATAVAASSSSASTSRSGSSRGTSDSSSSSSSSDDDADKSQDGQSFASAHK